MDRLCPGPAAGLDMGPSFALNVVTTLTQNSDIHQAPKTSCSPRSQEPLHIYAGYENRMI